MSTNSQEDDAASNIEFESVHNLMEQVKECERIGETPFSMLYHKARRCGDDRFDRYVAGIIVDEESGEVAVEIIGKRSSLETFRAERNAPGDRYVATVGLPTGHAFMTGDEARYLLVDELRTAAGKLVPF